MRKKKLFNCEVIFHLEESFMSSLLLLIQLQRKQNYGFFCCWSSGGMQQDHISPVTTYGPIWKQKNMSRIQALDWPGFLDAKISKTDITECMRSSQELKQSRQSVLPLGTAAFSLATEGHRWEGDWAGTGCSKLPEAEAKLPSSLCNTSLQLLEQN